MKYTVLKCHLPNNNYDGYDPHRHWMLIAVDPSVYFNEILGSTIYPDESWVDLIVSPDVIPWIKQHVQTVGYGFKEPVDPEHYGFYAFGNLHDGLDGQLLPGGPGEYVKTVYGTGYNTKGYHPSADVYSVDANDLLPTAKRYQTIEEIIAMLPWAAQTISDLIADKTLAGDGKGLDLSLDMIRLLVLNDRKGLYM